MNASQYREMTNEELGAAYSDASEEIFKLKIQQTLGQLENPARIRHLRRDIARIQTIQVERAQQEKSDV